MCRGVPGGGSAGPLEGGGRGCQGVHWCTGAQGDEEPKTEQKVDETVQCDVLAGRLAKSRECCEFYRAKIVGLTTVFAATELDIIVDLSPAVNKAELKDAELLESLNFRQVLMLLASPQQQH